MINDSVGTIQADQYKRPLVIYHGNCADGFSAAWCFYHSQEEAKVSYDFHAGVYGEELPDVEDRIVYMVDFSYKADKVAEILKRCTVLYFIDHHKTAIEDLKQFADHPKFVAYTDAERSGAMLAWDFLFNAHWEFPARTAEGYQGKPILASEYLTAGSWLHQPPPLLLDHVQDRDLWRFKLEGTRPIQAAMFAREYTFENWDEMMKPGNRGAQIVERTALWEQGQAIERKHFKDIKEFVEVAKSFTRFGGYRVPTVNVPYMWASDACHMLLEQYPEASFAAAYYDTAADRIYSLRSEDHRVDVSEIAKAHGGGGHRNAAGFKVRKDN
jgi:oligoribonuclease NrnB/cAMP/cGMP phosphodiesterase (DHH superfamily)